MRSIIVSLVLIIVAPSMTYAQPHSVRVYQTGRVTPGHLTMQESDGVVGDAGGANNGHLGAFGITPFVSNTNPPFCINDKIVSNPSGYHELCISSNAMGGGSQITFTALGGASTTPFTMSADNALILNSSIGNVQLTTLPTSGPSDVPVCINPLTGQLYTGTNGCVPNSGIVLTNDDGTVFLTNDDGSKFLTAR